MIMLPISSSIQQIKTLLLNTKYQFVLSLTNNCIGYIVSKEDKTKQVQLMKIYKGDKIVKSGSLVWIKFNESHDREYAILYKKWDEFN